MCCLGICRGDRAIWLTYHVHPLHFATGTLRKVNMLLLTQPSMELPQPQKQWTNGIVTPLSLITPHKGLSLSLSLYVSLSFPLLLYITFFLFLFPSLLCLQHFPFFAFCFLFVFRSHTVFMTLSIITHTKKGSKEWYASSSQATTWVQLS
jgi:hypothetical protein